MFPAIQKTQETGAAFVRVFHFNCDLFSTWEDEDPIGDLVMLALLDGALAHKLSIPKPGQALPYRGDNGVVDQGGELKTCLWTNRHRSVLEGYRGTKPG